MKGEDVLETYSILGRRIPQDPVWTSLASPSLEVATRYVKSLLLCGEYVFTGDYGGLAQQPGKVSN